MPQNKKTTAFKFLSIILSLSIVFMACEKEVKINIKSGEGTMVVDGAIETGQPPYVILTKTIGFFSKIDLSTLENSFIHGAVVTVSDGIKTVTLKEYGIDTGVAGKFYAYSIDTAAGQTMLGVVDRSYTLKIVYNGKTYEATAKIPNPKPMDSLYQGEPFKFGADTTAPGAHTLYVDYLDPDTPGNYARYFTQLNSGPMLASDDIYSDEFTNGSLQRKFPLTLGTSSDMDRNRNNADSFGYVFPGDTVTFKWCACDRKVYTFWRSYIYAGQVTGNPFSSPINLVSNMSNGALGVWSAYGTVYTTIIIQ